MLKKWSSLPFVLLGALLAAPAPARALDREVLSMGTRLGIHLEGAPEPQLQDASNRILAEMERIERACSTWRTDTSWARLNAARGEAVPMDAEWMELLESIRGWNARTEGAFDPVLMALMRAWGIREGGRTPSGEEVAEARRASGCGLLVLDHASGKARLKHPAAGVEEGGFLKGYALDAGRKVVQALGIPVGWLDFGGQLLVWGAPRDAAVADADDRQATRLRVALPDKTSLSSSGCSERGRHILDPLSGSPCPDWGAVAVVAEGGLDADVLSTSLYVMGPEKGLAWAERNGVAAAFQFHGGKVVLSRAFASLHPVLSRVNP